MTPPFVRQDVNKRRQRVVAGTKAQFIPRQCRDFVLTSERKTLLYYRMDKEREVCRDYEGGEERAGYPGGENVDEKL